MKPIPLKRPNQMRDESGRLAEQVRISRAERLADVSKRVRQESMRVNTEFAAIERDPDA